MLHGSRVNQTSNSLLHLKDGREDISNYSVDSHLSEEQLYINFRNLYLTKTGFSLAPSSASESVSSSSVSSSLSLSSSLFSSSFLIISSCTLPACALYSALCRISSRLRAMASSSRSESSESDSESESESSSLS